MTENLSTLITEAVNERSRDLDRLSVLEMVRIINDEDKKVASAVEAELEHIAQAIEIIAEALRKGGHLIYLGAGTSGRLGVLDAVECPPTFGLAPEIIRGVLAGGERAMFRSAEDVEDDEMQGAADLRREGITSADVIVGIAASGRTPYTIGGLKEARRRGCKTVAITNNPGSPMTALADVAITPVVGPEVLAGSTRMKAGTSQKIVLNMISTGVMVRLGKVYSNLMVDVRPTNGKLVERAKRIIREVTGLDRARVEGLWVEADQETRTAIVMALADCSAAEAREALARHGGRVREAVEERRGQPAASGLRRPS
ncbi:MAG: N-acetylmuramic acid 6-phosphate etherase [Firmicutes bacterium]|nr:N-acetylmuramic acid 6-phosphate etherase [Bacillota bacterium]MCL5039993.1 N-acetylmuramic acid 6-phosphate etherase [Bacillota bacterium]